MAGVTPAGPVAGADDDVGLAGQDGGQQIGQPLGRHGEVAVQPGHHRTPTLGNAPGDGRGQPALRGATDQAHPTIVLCLARHHLPGEVGRIVIHDNHLRLGQRLQHGLDERADVVAFVVGGQDDGHRIHWGLLHGVERSRTPSIRIRSSANCRPAISRAGRRAPVSGSYMPTAN